MSDRHSDINLASVITIDGPAGSGKGTIASLVAQQLGWHILDSGALYRLTAFAALQQNIASDNEVALSHIAKNLDVVFESGEIYLAGQCVTLAIRDENCGNMASKIAAIATLRSALLQRQRDFQQAPGLIADGRDMGTVVFPDAPIKIFLTASAEERGKRRLNQLKQNKISASLTRLIKEIKVRDARDMNRQSAPLKAADDAVVIDSSFMTISEVVDQVILLTQRL
jgi:cytidylate kinase